MLVVNRFVVADDAESVSAFTGRAGAAIEALAARPGYQGGQLGRAYDDPTRWSLVTQWESVGAYRRALGAFEVKVNATPLLAESMDEPSAFEVLATAPPGGTVQRRPSDLADPADECWPGAAPTSSAADERWPGAAPTSSAADERWPGAAPTSSAAREPRS